MDAIFLQLFNMSIAASWIVLAVVLLRLLLKKAPKAFACALWVIVAIRLVCPFSFESVLSLIPSAETVPQNIVYAKEPVINSGISSINQVVNPIITETFAPPNELTSVNPIQIFLAVVANLWVLGMIGMLIYTLISYMRLRRRVREAVPFSDGVWICDNINTPFILGVLRPRIYLPSAMDKANTEYVIAHERAHLSRRDHLWKPLGFLLLTVYWFNPVMWLAYVLLCRDIELACDERVIRDMNADDKKAYSTALLECSIPRRMISACPLAFGEVGVKQRIKSVLSYKKPAFWLIVAALVVCVAVAVCFLTNPKEEDYSDLPSVSEHAYEVDEVVYGALYLSTLMFPGQNTPYFSITDDLDLLRKAEADTNEGWVDLGKLESITLSKYNFDVFFDIDNGLGWADDVSAKSIRTETAKAWRLADDELYYVLQQKDGSVYLAYGSSSKIHHVFKLETNIHEDTGLIAISGANTVPIKVLTTEHSLEEIKNEVYWLDITFGENQFTPFDIYGDGNRQLGLFNIYDANTFEPLDFFTPSGLDPHTYIFQNATDGGEYIITMRWEYGIEEGSTALLCFGARLPMITALTKYESAQTYIKEAKGIQTFSDEWYEGNKLYSTALNYGASDTENSYSAPIHRFDTLGELEIFKANFSKIYIFNKTYQEVTSFHAATEGYDESFFVNNSLFVVYIRSTSGACRYAIESIVNDGENFVINVGLTNGPRTNDWQEWFLTLAIAKEEIESCTAFDAQVYAKEVAAENIELTTYLYGSGVVNVQLATVLSDPIYTDALNSEKFRDGFTTHDFPIHNIETFAELEAFREKHADLLLPSSRYDEEYLHFANITYHCDEAYFEEHNLLVAYIAAPSSGDRYEISGIGIDHTGFSMQIEKTVDGKDMAMKGWLAYVAIDKDRISDCSAFNAYLTNAAVSENYLVGTWEMPIGVMGLPAEETPENPTLRLTFNEDHTGVENAAGVLREFVYRTENDLLEITYTTDDASDDFTQYTYRISGDMLTLTDVQNFNRAMDLKKVDTSVPVTEQLSGKLSMSFFGAQNLPLMPKEVDNFTFDFEQNGDRSVLRGENKEYLDNAHLSSLETDEPVFSFSLYQDALEYTEALLAILNSVVTVDYEGNTFDTTDAIKEHIYVSMNDIPAVVTEVRLGKGNGHLDFYFKFKTESKIEFKDIKTFNFVVK